MDWLFRAGIMLRHLGYNVTIFTSKSQESQDMGLQGNELQQHIRNY